MKRRKLLLMLAGLATLAGFIMASIPFMASMNPNQVAKSKASVWVEIANIPEVGVLEVDYGLYKALIVKNPQITVFLVPFTRNAYLLPDPTWQRAFIPCHNFIIATDGFACEDSSLYNSWLKEARWDLQGKNKGTWMPDLQTTNFRLQGKYLLLSPEFN
jgi:hypothetical protein